MSSGRTTEPLHDGAGVAVTVVLLRDFDVRGIGSEGGHLDWFGWKWLSDRPGRCVSLMQVDDFGI
jgi:hypothetical protein